MYISGETDTDREIMAEVGKRLRALRKVLGMSVAEAAERTELNKNTITRAEQGDNPTLLTVLKLLRAYGRLGAMDGFIPEPELSPMQLLARRKKGQAGA